MSRAEVIAMYQAGKNHRDIAHAVYAYNRATDRKYTYDKAEKFVIDVIMEANKRSQ